MSLPYLPLYVDDYEADTAHLTLVEDGIYSRLLRLCWRTPGCKLPNDQEWIARKVRVSDEAELAALNVVLKEFFTTKRGSIFSKRLRAEYEQASATVQKRKEAGKSGGLAKSRKSNGFDPSKARDGLQHPEPEPEPEPYPNGKPGGFPERADARKKPKGWVDRPTHSQALNDTISRIEQHEQRRTEISGPSAQTPVQLLSAGGARGR